MNRAGTAPRALGRLGVGVQAVVQSWVHVNVQRSRRVAW